MPLKDRKRRTAWHRRIFQLRLATLLGLVLFVSFCLGLHRFVKQRYYEQQSALKEVSEKVVFLKTEPGKSAFLQYLVEEEAYKDVTQLSFHGDGYRIKRITDKEMPHLRHFPQLKRLSLHRGMVTDDSLKYLSGLHQLEALSLNHTKITDDGLKHLKGLTKLRELHLDVSGLNREGVKHLAGMKDLKILELRCKDLQDKDLGILLNMRRLQELTIRSPGLKRPAPYLATLKRLRKVRISGENIDRFDLAEMPELTELRIGAYYRRTTAKRNDLSLRLRDLPRLKTLVVMSRYNRLEEVEYVNLPSLENLYLPNAKRVVLVGLPSVKKLRVNMLLRPTGLIIRDLPGLKNLSLSGRNVPAQAWQQVGSLTSLETLTLGSLGVNDSVVASLAPLKNLQNLYLNTTNIYGSGFAALKNLKNLKLLSLQSATLRNEHMHHIGALTSLEHLVLFNTALNDRGLAQLGGLTNLKMLSLQGTHIEGLGLAALKNCEKLEQLNFSETRVKDEGLTFLPPLPSLTILQAGNLKITDASIDTLIEWKQLKSLGLYRCNLTPQGAKLLRAAMPGTNVQVSPNPHYHSHR